MSVIIKGMKMPMGCYECPCSNDESRYCNAANEYIPMLGKPKFCPLVEIPTPKNRPATWGDVFDSLKVLEALLETIEAEEGGTRCQC